MEIPIEIFSLFIGSSIALAIFGFLRNPQIPATLAFAGIFILTISVITTSIGIGYSESEFIQIPSYSVSHPMNVTTSSTSIAFSATVTGISERPININSVLINKKINCIEINMLRTGNPTDNVMVGILDNDNRMVKLFGNITASTIATGTRSYQFCLPNHDYWIIAYNDYIGAKHLGSVGVNNIAVSLEATGTFDGGNSKGANYISGLWSDFVSADLRMKLTTENIEIENIPIEGTSNPNSFEFTNMHKVLFALLGSVLMLAGGLMVYKGD